MKIYRFRNCYLHTAERRVLKDKNYLDLTTKTFDVLQLLIESRGKVVTKDEILEKVWNGSYVEEANLAVHISKLRRMLDEARNQTFIETIQGTGYRFVAPVEETPVNEWAKLAADVTVPEQNKTPSEWTFDSIAVMPLDNESRDEEIEYLADGLTESFINSLSRLPNLRVIARNTVFRYKNKNFDAKQVGETLGVATVLTGRIRVLKDRLTIGIELTKIQDGTQLWGTHINRSFTDIFEMQESIMLEVLESLKSEINKAASTLSTNLITKHPESYRLYLKGKYLLEKFTQDKLNKAIEYFKQSISHDPLNVHSNVEIIESYFLLYFSDHISYSVVLKQINPYLSIVSEFDQSIDVVQAMYGGKKFYLDWDLIEANRHLQNALTLNPNCLTARYRYSDLMLLTGKFSDSLKQLQHIMLIDPLSFPTYRRIGRLFYKMRHYESAVNYLKDALEIEPFDYVTLAILGATLTELGKYEEALSTFQKSLDNYYSIEVVSMIGYVYALQGKKGEALEVANQITSFSQDISQNEIKLARIYATLGENEKAYDFLEQAFKNHNVDFIHLIMDPRWKSISNEARFKEFISRINFPKD